LDSEQRIGIFDSGLGGLSVARAVLRCLPNESLIYFADLAHKPYSGKEQWEVVGFVRDIVSFLSEKGVKLVLAACNVAAAIAPFTALAKIQESANVAA